MTPRPRVLLALPRYRGFNHGLFLGVAGLVAALKASGAEAMVLDEDVAARAEEHDGCSVEEIVRRVIADFRPTLLGVHVSTPNYASALRLATCLRSHSDAPLVAGGPHATVAAGCMLERHRQFDFVLRGEADLTLPALAWALVGRGTLNQVAGLSSRINGRIVHQQRPPLMALGDLPRPDRRALLEPPEENLRRHARQRYQENFSSSIPGLADCEVAGAYATRGCHAACPFCSPTTFWAEPETGRTVRRLRPVAELMAELGGVRDLGYGAVFFDEPTFPLASEPVWLGDFCAGMRELGLKWGAPTRLDELDPTLLPELARSGLRYVYFGLETPQLHLQRALKKPADLSTVLTVLAACEDHGVQCDLSLFFGAPGETEETIDATLEWIDHNLPNGNAFFSVAAYWPGTPWAEGQGLSPECWEPDFDRTEAERRGAVWYPETAVSIERFYSNSTGTYHPAFMSVERALAIKERIISSGFRARFRRHSRSPSGEGAAAR